MVRSGLDQVPAQGSGGFPRVQPGLFMPLNAMPVRESGLSVRAPAAYPYRHGTERTS